MGEDLVKKLFFILFLFDVFFSCVVYSQSVNEELSDNLLRLHVISNSNSECDIDLKYKVRVEILRIVGDRKYKNREEVITTVTTIEDEINQYLNKESIVYDCKIVCTTSQFPTKRYNNIIMPAGDYLCIKAVLGKGEGENWWCVAYPPLCFTEEVFGNISDKGEQELKKNLSEDVYNLIRNTDDNKIRFYSVDLVNRVIQYMKR